VSAGAGPDAVQGAAPRVVLRGLVKRFGARRALDGIDLVLEGPQRVGVVGPDGAGKTTLLRAVVGLLDVEAEEARVLGVDLRGDVRGLKARLGYVPQVWSLQRELTVSENLAFTARLHRLDAAELERRAAPLLERTGLAPFRDRAAGALSGGMKQKLAVANALLPEPELLVLDEPTAGVDVEARAEIWELLAERRSRTLILLSTSYLDEAAACERLVYLDAGRVVASGTPEALRAGAGLELYQVFGAEPRALARAARALPFVSSTRAAGAGARVEVARAASPGSEAAARALRALPGARLVEARPADLESVLLALARGSAEVRTGAGARA
jgi:ABC-2 type transport system ATP-binding protein